MDQKEELRTAREKARKEGLEEGREEGRKEGLEEGEKKKAIEVAKGLIGVLDVETIAKKTGLDVEEVEELLN